MTVEESSQARSELDQIVTRKNLYINDYFDELTRDIDVDIETHLESLATPSEKVNALRDGFLRLLGSEKSRCLANAFQVVVDRGDSRDMEPDQILHETRRRLFCSNTLLYIKSASPRERFGYLVFVEGFYMNNKEVNLIRYALLLI